MIEFLAMMQMMRVAGLDTIEPSFGLDQTHLHLRRNRQTSFSNVSFKDPYEPVQDYEFSTGSHAATVVGLT